MVHYESEHESFKIAIPDHPQREESSEFRHSKELAHKIIKSIDNFYAYGDKSPVQMHHGGSLYLYDDQGWFLARNLAGMEWSAQWCASPERVEILRRNAARIYAGFPLTLPKMQELGYEDIDILTTPIVDAAGVARWTDSIFNSCIPLPANRHSAVLRRGAGVHHYPAPVTDIELIKKDDFILWITDPQSGHQIAIVPHPDGIKAQVVYAPVGTKLHKRLLQAHQHGQILEVEKPTSS